MVVYPILCCISVSLILLYLYITAHGTANPKADCISAFDLSVLLQPGIGNERAGVNVRVAGYSTRINY